MKELKFRRQFILSPVKTDEFSNWNLRTLGGYFLYSHPDLQLAHASSISKDVVLLGHVLDPKNHEITTQEVIRKIVEATTELDIAKELYGLVGRFVLIIKNMDNFLFFNDACGLKSFFYTQYHEKLYLASQPLLLNLVTENLIIKGERYYSYHDSEYVKGNNEHWFPSGTSLYKDVYHLVPNHYLNSSNLKQVRYWPSKELKIEEYDISLKKFYELLRQTLSAGTKKYKLALGLTGGYDSRMLLSATKDVKDKFFYYTLLYRDLNDDSSDVRIPANLANKLGFDYHKLDCRMELDEHFKNLYLQSSDMAHLDDWGHIAYGISQMLPKDLMSVKGSCSETGRCFFYKNGKHPNLSSGDGILEINPQWKQIPFVVNRIHEWFDEVKLQNVNKNYNILDLFHWEMSTGGWQSQSQLEWDLVHDTFTPFNNRELLDIMLNIDTKYRSKPNYKLYRDGMEMLWPEVLSEPINPLKAKREIKSKIKDFLAKIGFEKYNR